MMPGAAEPRPEPRATTVLRQLLVAALRPRVVAHAHGGGDDAHGSSSAGRHRAHPLRPHAVAPSPLVALGAGARHLEQARVGGKARSLAWLAAQGVPVPVAVAVPAEVAARVASGDPLATELLASALRRWLDPAATYAVRSSADGEDGELHSFAGQFQSRLAVPADGVLDAVRDVAAPDADRVATYAQRTGVTAPARIAVVVQEMVDAVASGIAFSRNPVTGLDEVVVEAIPGRGDALAADGVTPDRWIRRWGAFTEAPRDPRVEAELVEAVARETVRLAAADSRPIDVEWASDGTTTWWLQARPMTGLDGLRVYSRRIARDVLPGVIKPLVWSVNVPLVNAAWLEVLEELVGPIDVRPEDLARSLGYRAYFDMTTIGSVFETLGMPRDSLELLLGLPRGPEAPRFRPGAGATRHVPRMLRFGARFLRRGRWARAELRALWDARAVLAAEEPSGLDGAGLLRRLDAIEALGRRAAYANIVVPLTMLAYDRALATQLRSAGVDPATVDPAAERGDRATWSPAAALDALAAVAAGLPHDARRALAERRTAAIRERDDLSTFGTALDIYLARFGHLSDSSNDLSLPAWSEDPDHVVDLALAHRARSDELPATTGPTLGEVLARVPMARRPLVRRLWRRAGAFRVYRDAVGGTWARVYGLFRPTFLVIGTRLAERGALDARDDVFYLATGEVRALLSGATPAAGDPRSLVAHRRSEVAEAAAWVVPEIVYGDAFVARRPSQAGGVSFTGIPTSRGSVRGTARIVRGTSDFGRVSPGDVIVVPFSDVAWTPLFARAGGVVAEAGGMLSHSSVVAREYGIPCIVSVPEACSRIPDGATVVLDGMNGTVEIEAPG
jgi:pyruvate,water dikinase